VAEKTKEAIEIECGNDKYVETGDGFDLGKEKFREKEKGGSASGRREYQKTWIWMCNGLAKATRFALSQTSLRMATIACITGLSAHYSSGRCSKQKSSAEAKSIGNRTV
jgi:hypothetical protein